MPVVTITVECGNAAFDDHPGEALADILEGLAHDAERFAFVEQLDGYVLRDTNGNTVGRVTVDGE